MSKGFLKKYLSQQDLGKISSAIAEAELQTNGEIRVSIRHRRHWRERKLSLHEVAVFEFHRMKMHETSGRSAVLIFLLFNERVFHIVADEGIHSKVSDGTWERIAKDMSQHFREGNFASGICAGVDAVGAVLRSHFPRTSDHRNELSDEVNIS